ncbi:deoxynucleoside kinase [Mycoplasma sp. OR1901]|uniref:deoxynucleoside kinase n=1 Tax=Mycoplasma sp. OR1901 TaxID=2742195 RepID=UPI0015833A8F|nr:deoxynucleoside kinase [Mycoplasma sp. OR1901]QKT05273.1 deoxynucleoside kinase [Mycoplasma sp. OR1901]
MIIGISGMISGGKSTLTKKLKQHYENSLLLEEFEENDEVFNQFLEWLYSKKENLTMGFQAYVIENHTTKLNEIIDKFYQLGFSLKENHIFLDRFSIEHYIFASVILAQKGTNYLKGYDALFNNLIMERETPDLAIYLDMDYETFENRLFKRGREVEINHYSENIEYFKNLFSLYRDIFEKQAKKYNLNYVIIDTKNLNEEEVFDKTIEIIENYKTNNIKERVK